MNNKKLTGLGLKSRAMTSFSQFIWASDNIRTRLYSVFAEHGITASQFGVLDVLYHFGTRSQKELGSHILKSGGNVTMVVDNLEKNGLVRRERSQEDRRFIQVHITDKGKKLFSKLLPVTVSFIEKEMSVLSSHELEELGRLCVKLVNKK